MKKKAIHKSKYSKESDEFGNKCGSKSKNNSYRWKGVDCNKCLKHKPEEKVIEGKVQTIYPNDYVFDNDRYDPYIEDDVGCDDDDESCFDDMYDDDDEYY